MSVIEELNPPYAEEPRFKLELLSPRAPVHARRATSIIVDVSACEPYRPVLPIEIVITGPSAKSFVRRVDRRIVRDRITFTPREGGRHTIVMRELGHNRWWGRLDVDVLGDRSDDTREPTT